jgi:phage repressor protein C with HTH and peptisase S24 domain
MQPTYAPGDVLVGLRWFRARPGQVVVARHERPLIKRVKSVSGRSIWLEGDNAAASTDSRQFGPVARRQLEAKIIGKLW